MSPGEFRRLGHRAVDWVADYWSSLDSLPVLSRVAPGQVRASLPADPPEKGAGEAGYDDVFADLSRIILPGLTHWQSPNFFAFFPANASTPGVIGELLSAGLGVQGMLWATSPACTELETLTLDWLAKATGLPEKFLSTSAHGGGVIQGTASEATLVALLSARRRALQATSGAPGSAAGVASGGGSGPPDSDQAHECGPEHALVMYASTQAHSSVMKAAMITGLALGPDDKRRVRLIETDEHYAMDPAALERAMRDDVSRGLVPCCVVASVGTTGTTAIDPVDRIAAVIDRVSTDSHASGGADALSATGRAIVRPWLHVDAAHAGAACVCPEMRWIFRGIDRADSLCFNPHKWLLTNFDCDAYWTGDRDALVGAMSITPEYLRNSATDSGRVIDYRDWQVPLGRRFRALKLWLVMRHFGLDGLRAHVRSHITMAEWFEARVREDVRFEIAAPRTMNLVCFRLRGHCPESDARNKALMDRLNQSGELYLTHTVLPKSPAGTLAGRLVLRMAIGASTTAHEHVARAWDRIKAAANAL
ncbi:MAG: aspartate aminotransferase family protein [Phycisphaerales bacterium]|nr:aspartate aminotransferase family protein [Phycisphaerales bacterium]